MRASDPISRVSRYYDANTERFLRFGRRGDIGTIRRAVWAPTVRSEREAFEYVDQLILSYILQRRERREQASELSVLDLGCGVGASLQYLAQRGQLRGTGITLSKVQAELAQRRIAAAGLEQRVRVLKGSYLDLPAELGSFHAAFSIEAFVHSPDAAGYLQQVERHLEPSGLLIIVDDVLTDRAATSLDPHEARILDAFRHGWAVSTLQTPEAIAALAAKHGLTLTDDVDLTPYLKLGRPRDRLIRVLASASRWVRIESEYLNSLLGGNALQQALATGLVDYRALVFEKAAAPSAPG